MHLFHLVTPPVQVHQVPVTLKANLRSTKGGAGPKGRIIKSHMQRKSMSARKGIVEAQVLRAQE
jgi:hypothetical protein